MALNIAVPLSGVGGLSPISPIGIDCWENIKILVSPIGSESSGVSSLDSEEAKQQQQQKQSSPPPEQQSRNSLSPEKQPEQQKPQQEQKQEELKNSVKEPPKKSLQDLKIIYNGRDILDLAKNTEINTKLWNLCYTYLPENNNIPMFLANRSQYHRLGANGHIHEYSLVKCDDCDFQYPMNSSSSFFYQTSVAYSLTTNSAMTYTGPSFYNKLVTTNSVNTYGKNYSNNNHQQKQMQQNNISYQNHQQQQQLYNNQNNINKNYSTNIVENLFGGNNGFLQGKKIPSPTPPTPTITPASNNYAAAFNKNTITSFPFSSMGTNSTPSSSKSAISTISNLNGTMMNKSATFATNVATTSCTLNNTSPSSTTITSSLSSGFISPNSSSASMYEKYQMMNNNNNKQQQQQQQSTSSMFMQNNHQQKTLNNANSSNYNKTAPNTAFNSNFYSLLNSLNNGLGNNSNNNNNISSNNSNNNGGSYFQTNNNSINATAAANGNNNNNSFAMFMNGGGQQQQNFTRMYKYF